MSPNWARFTILSALACAVSTMAGCIPAIVVGVAATSGGGGGGGGGGGTTAAAAFSVSPVSGHQDAQQGSTVEVVIAPGGPSLAGQAPSLSVEGLPALQVTVLGPDRFRFVLPDNPRGNKSASVVVVVTLPGWRAETTIHYRAFAPTITGVSPSQVMSSGSGITVSGTGFVEGSVVEIGSHIVFPSSLSARSISCVTPQAPAGSVLDLSVRHPEGFRVTRAAALSVVGPPGPSAPVPPTITIVSALPSGPIYYRQRVRFKLEVRDSQGDLVPDGYTLAVTFGPFGHLYQTTLGRIQVDESMSMLGPLALAYVHYATSLRVDAGVSFNVQAWQSDSLRGWEPRRVGLAGVDARAVDRAPDDPLVLYTGGPGGVWWSPDEGASWTQRPIPGNPVVQGLLARTGGLVYAASAGGVWRSPDAGVTWGARSTGLPNLNVSGIAATQSGSLIAATAGGVALSADSGANWIGGGALPATPQVLATATSVDRTFVGAGAGVYRSLDGGASWTQVDVGFSGSPITAVACDGTGLNVAAGVASGLVYRSADAGATWTSGVAASSAGRPIAALSRVGAAWVCAVSGQGVFASGGTGPWEPRSACLGDRDLRGLDVYDADRWAIATGPGGVWTTTRGGRSTPWQWLERLPTTAANFSDITALTALREGDALFVYFWSLSVLLKSSDGGQSWFVSPLIRSGGGSLLEGDRQHLYFDQGWGSHDGGGSWEAIGIREGSAEVPIQVDQRGQPLRLYRSGGLSLDGGRTFQTISAQATGSGYAFAQSRSNPARLYFAGGAQVYRSDDRGLSWTSVSSFSSVRSVAVDPLDPDRVVVSAFTSTGQPPKLYLSPDAGATWFEQASGPSRPRWSHSSGRLYAHGYSGGFLRSLDQGNTWLGSLSWRAGGRRGAEVPLASRAG